ncbi:NADP-dependent oxidoreductase domain-containing protein [Amylocarpus encephaloides]|uniref:NADP-dependent oxidoreductase domain-containing protein n=1 Tax=Amylocarpus encephaloides TaxID=45428 RepID=A0A9P8C2D4_9HELO|nr:NADP-dependent oxidoreductase domain-containing protein [Amylocarpus encephaloides]
MADTKFKLNTGAEIPALGLGTWQSAAGEVEKAVSYALSNGYKHIDAAYCYGNEDEVGQGLKTALESGVKREDIFVTTKLWCTYHSRVEAALDKSLKSLGLDYVDLYLMHWPVAMNPDGNHEKFPKLPDGSRDLVKDWSHIQTWKLMEKLLATGKVKAIGVANYSVKYLNQLLPEATVVPAVNQIENHPSLPQQELVDFCKSKGIHVTAYSPLGSTGSPMFTAAPVVKVAEKRGVTPATVLLGYHIPRGSSVLAKSVNPERIKANKGLITLDDSDMKILDDYAKDLEATGKVVRYVYPAFGVNFGFADQPQGIIL